MIDATGRATGCMFRDRAHRDPPVLHVAISVQVVDPDGHWLLQRRATDKALFAGHWTNSCCTHAVPGEAAESTGLRRLREELGLVAEGTLVPVATFTYRATDSASGLVEYEQDHVFAVVARIMCSPWWRGPTPITPQGIRRDPGRGERPDVAHRGAQGGAAADRVAGPLTEHQVEVGAAGSERRVAGQVELHAGLSPAVLAAHDRRVEGGVERRPGADAAVGRLDPDPVPGGDVPLTGRVGVQLDLP